MNQGHYVSHLKWTYLRICLEGQKNREIYISLRDFQGLSCLYLVASWVFHICTLCWEHSSLSVPRPLSYSLLLFTAPSRAPYGLAGALTIYNIKDTASDDGALNLVILSLFRSRSSDGLIYHLARLWLSLLKHSFRQQTSSMEEVNQSSEARHHLWFPCSTSLRLEIWGLSSALFMKAGLPRKEPFMRVWSRLGRGSGYILSPLLRLCLSVCVSLFLSWVLWGTFEALTQWWGHIKVSLALVNPDRWPLHPVKAVGIY